MKLLQKFLLLVTALSCVYSYGQGQLKVDNWSFQYRYDAQKRLIGKKIPGAGWVYIVYDNRDRVVLTQDANQRQAKLWAFTKYDERNRPVLTGIKDTSVSLTQPKMQSVVDKFYERPGAQWGEKMGGPVHGYTNRSYPLLADPNKYLTVAYYDSYDFRNFISGGERLNFSAGIPGQASPTQLMLAGQATGSKVKVLDGGTWGGTSWLSSAIYYDDKLRVIQTVSDNLKGGVDRSSSTLDFSGKVLMSKIIHSTSPSSIHSVTRRMDYDHAGRLVRTWHRLDDGNEIVLSQNEFNEIGQLVDKKLHSSNAGLAFIQSLDYRYNIRGWMTSLNGSELEAGTRNDDDNDLFGFALNYNAVDGVANAPQFNGNISSMKWSNNLGLGNPTEHGYSYSYDVMNRIAGANFKVKNAAWTTPVSRSFSESGPRYDLNGNILQTSRRGENGKLLDSLTYDYGLGIARSNRLLNVVDRGDGYKGFKDVTAAPPDYTYDSAGNMLTDQNKGITSAIIYNFLNLPETITRGAGNSVRYVYDATGRKLRQVTTYSATQRTIDYAGEFQYEDNILQHVNHDEGRIILTERRLVYHNDGDNLAGVSPQGVSPSLVGANGSQTYLRVNVTSIGSRPCLTLGTIIVNAGERYLVRLRGYRTGAVTKTVHLSLKVNGSYIGWPGATLASSNSTECWIEQLVTIPPGGTTLSFGAGWNTSVAVGDTFFLNDFEVMQLTTSGPEYQYNFRDHLGNVRMTFTTRVETETSKATLEPENEIKEAGEFLRFDKLRRVRSHLFDHTNGSAPVTTPGYAQRLNGTSDERVGLARSLSVMPGDTVRINVFAKYVDTNQANWSAALRTLLSQIMVPLTAPPGTIIDGTGYAGNGTAAISWAQVATAVNNESPNAGLKYIMFDRDFKPIMDPAQTNFVQISNAAREYGQDVPHEKLTTDILVKQPGYLYVYLSNDQVQPLDVYFDDFEVEHAKGPVVQTQEYFPFGLTFNSYSRENSVPGLYQFNSKEVQDKLGIGWLDFGSRMYQSDIGRWMVVDPLSDKMRRHSPYSYTFNNPIRFTDPDGMAPDDPGNPLQVIGEQLSSLYNFFTGNSSTDYKAEVAARMILPISATQVALKTMYNLVGDEHHTISKAEYTEAARDVVTLVPAILTGPEAKATRLSSFDDRLSVASNFYQRAGYSAEKATDHMEAINFDLPVSEVTLRKGTIVQQWVGENGAGSYFTNLENGSKMNLGIEYKNRTLEQFKLPTDINALRSTTGDFKGNRGGGIQYFSPELKSLLKEE